MASHLCHPEESGRLGLGTIPPHPRHLLIPPPQCGDISRLCPGDEVPSPGGGVLDCWAASEQGRRTNRRVRPKHNNTRIIGGVERGFSRSMDNGDCLVVLHKRLALSSQHTGFLWTIPDLPLPGRQVTGPTPPRCLSIEVDRLGAPSAPQCRAVREGPTLTSFFLDCTSAMAST